MAIIEADEAWHLPCLEALQAVQMPLLTAEAVLTELFHLIFSGRYSIQKAWTFLGSGALTVRGVAATDFPELHALMARYHDRRMNFTDATLVHLAARESLSLILTLDHNDFETYRIGGRKKFSILPARAEKLRRS